LKVDQKTLEEIEFYPLIDTIKNFSFSEYGRRYFNSLNFDEDPAKIYSMVEEMMNHIQEMNSAISRVDDVSEFLKNVKAGKHLDPHEFISIAELLRVSKRISEVISNFQTMKDLSEYLVPPKGFIEVCDRTFNPDGTIKDNATPELVRIRKEIRAIENSIDDQMKRFLSDGVKEGFVSEALIVQRHERYVLPVDASKRSMVKGIIHGQSASGLTYYIEPEAMIELNDSLAIAKSKESIEISKLLNFLFNMVSDNLDLIFKMIEVFEKIDGVYARATYGQENECVIPYKQANGTINIIGGRNPLIPLNKVVPIDLELKPADKITIISGPNTGGKTATLKTVGLFSLMYTLGIPLPSRSGTEFSQFDALYSDIGDNQSVRNELSTFSSRVIRADEICKRADEKTLILIDEIGEGTEPAEGAAFAKAIIDILISKGSKVILTTHLPELKALAFMMEGIRNASVGFDVEKMAPTYRIYMDMPGRSRALEIVQKLGVSEELVENFKNNRSVSFSQSDLLIEELQTRINEYEEKIEQLGKKERDLEENEKLFNERFEKLKKKELEALSDEIRELSEKLRNMKKESEEAIHLLRTSKDEEELIRQDRRIQELRKKIDSVENKSAKGISIEAGTYVEIKGTQTVGKVLSVKKGKALIDIDGSEVETPLEMLQITGKPEKRTVETVEYISERPQKEIDIRGMTVEDALPIVEEFVDSVLKSNSSGLIIHGKGTGRLSNGVWAFLRSKHVQFRIGKAGEGGTGVTVVGDNIE
jgi:DNA mismatch repair protein MutS2